MQPGEQFAGKRRLLALILLGVLISVGFVALLKAQTSSQSAQSTQAKITWSQSQIEVTLSPGESTAKDITFSSSLPLQNAVVEPVPQIAPFVTVQPSTFANVPAGQSQPIHLALSVPTGTALGTYQGTIHVRVGTQTFPQTVKIVINVWQHFSDSGLNLTVYYPPTWDASRIDSTRVGFYPVGKPPDLSQEYVGDIVLEVIQNPSGLDLDGFYATVADVNLFKNSASFTRLTVNGAPAVKFLGVNGMIPTDLLAINKGQAVIEVSDVGQLHETDGMLDLIAKSIH